MSNLKVDTISSNATGSVTFQSQARLTQGAVVTGTLTATGGLTAAGIISSGTEIEGAALDINGNGDVSGQLTCGSLVTDGAVSAASMYVQGVQLQPHIWAFASFDGSALNSAKNLETFTDDGSGNITFEFTDAPDDSSYVVIATNLGGTGGTLSVSGKTTASFTVQGVGANGCDVLVLDQLVDETIDALAPPLIALDDLSDVSITGPTAKQILYYNGTEWRNVSLSATDIASGTFDDDRIAQSNVKQHEDALAIAASQLTSGSLSIDLIPSADRTYNIGNEDYRWNQIHADIDGAILFRAKNDSGGVLSVGDVVYISGSTGAETPDVDLADANDAAKMPAFGVISIGGSDGAEVHVTTFGSVLNVDLPSATYAVGDEVFVSTTAGEFTNTAPTGESSALQKIGYVTRVNPGGGPGGTLKVMGAGRTNAVPNLNQDKIFLGNASNQAVSTALSSINLSKFNNDLPAVSDSYAMFIETPSDKTYTVEPYAPAARTVTRVTAKTSAGTCNLLLANGANSQAILAVSSVQATSTSIFNASVSAGDRLTVAISSTSSAEDLEISVEYTQ